VEYYDSVVPFHLLDIVSFKRREGRGGGRQLAMRCSRERRGEDRRGRGRGREDI
jgi:hypothetical protein